MGGTLDIHCKLEEEIAAFKGCEDALVYTSDFGSNCNSLLAMLGSQDIAVLDQYVHASIVDGCQNTNVRYFRHNNLEALEEILQKAQNEYITKMVVVDGVYSMDKDIAPLDKIIDIAHHYGAYVMVDEAHATGSSENREGELLSIFTLKGKWILWRAPSARVWVQSAVYSLKLTLDRVSALLFQRLYVFHGNDAPGGRLSS